MDDTSHQSGPRNAMLKWRHRLRSALLSANYWTEHIVEPERIHRLIDRLAPTAIDRPLIRLGAKGDGGYLVPDDLEGIGALISPGVNYECSFDRSVADRGIDVFMADASVSGPPEQHPRFHFSKLFLDTYESEQTITLDAFCAPVAPGRDLLLEMDIEGAEYRVLASASQRLIDRFRIIVLEVHYLQALLTPFGFQQIEACFDRLRRTHEVVHIHPNNAMRPVTRGDLSIPPALEITLYRKDRVRPVDRALVFPHPLDATNIPNLPDYPLPSCWQGLSPRP